MTKPILHFAHANSYPAGTYRLFFEQLREHYDIRALPMHAHNPAYPVDDGWKSLARELSDTLAEQYKEPVILVGHSLGGILSLRAAQNRPDLVRCVVLLDSPIVGGWRAAALRVMKAFNFEHKKAPSRYSVKRRNLWPDRASSYQHFASKRVFASWPEEVLKDYVEHGLIENREKEEAKQAEEREERDKGEETGVSLRFSREIETAIYRTIPHDLGHLTQQNFPVKVGFVGGTDSVECRLAGLKATKRLVGNNFTQIPGGHLFPMSTPKAAADATHQMIEKIQANG
ncbi:MAG TPA: alpha/beta hydrolase [Herbaspirillum sp.]|jgi:pimeloyl-ACP methyl ester carboxylesterase